MVLKKSLAILKEKFHSLFLLEMAFVFVTFFFLVFVRNKIRSYVALVSEYSPTLTAIQEAAMKETLNTAEAMQALSAFEGTLRGAIFFGYVIVPLILFAIWCIFQSIIWMQIKEKKVKQWKQFFFQLCLISLTVFAIAYVVLKWLVQDSLTIATMNTVMMKIMLGLFVFFYFLTIAYACLQNHPLKKVIKRSLRIAITKVHLLIVPVALLFIVFFFATLLLVFPLFQQYTQGTILTFSPLFLVLYLLVCVALIVLLKIVIQVQVDTLK